MIIRFQSAFWLCQALLLQSLYRRMSIQYFDFELKRTVLQCDEIME